MNNKFTKMISMLSAAAIMVSASVVPVSAEIAPVQSSAEYSVGALATPGIAKTISYTDAITIKWNKVKGATGYRVYKKVGDKYKCIVTIKNGSTLKYKVKDLKYAKTYGFKVRAFKKSGGKTSWSKFSALQRVKTKPDYSMYGYQLDESAHRYKVSTKGFYYFLEDIDGNGVKELFAPTAWQYNMGTFEVYTLKSGDVIRIGDISTEVLSKDGNKYYANFARQGSYSISSVTIKNNKLVVKEIDSGYTEGEYPKYGEFCKEYDFWDRTPFEK